MSLQCFSQQDTIITNPNKLVFIPRYVLVNVVKDLKNCDLAKEELEVLTIMVKDQDNYIEYSDSIQISMKSHIEYLTNLNEAKNEQLGTLLSDAAKLNKKVRRQQGWIKTLGIALIFSIITISITN